MTSAASTAPAAVVTRQPPVGKLLERACRVVVVDVGARVEGQPRQPGVEPCRVHPAGAVEHDPAVVGGRADLVGQLVAGHEADRLTRVGVLLRGLAEVGHEAGGVRQVQLAGARVVARDRLVGDQRLDPVEGLVHLVVQPGSERAELAGQRGRAALQLGDDHAAVAGVRPPPEALLLEHDDRRARPPPGCVPRPCPAKPPPTTTTSAWPGRGRRSRRGGSAWSCQRTCSVAVRGLTSGSVWRETCPERETLAIGASRPWNQWQN